MLRHIALFRLEADAPAETTKSFEDGLFQLAQTIPDISAYSFGPDLGLREGNFDFAVVADFEDRDAFARYVAHPDHQAFIRDRLAPVVAERVSLQFDLGAPSPAEVRDRT
jgi:hypothetical protein